MGRKLSRPVQLTFDEQLRQRREGAGRKRKKDCSIPHAKREDVPKNNPVMVTLKLRSGLPDLRRRAEFELILASFRLAQAHAKQRGASPDVPLAHLSSEAARSAA